LSYQTAIKYLDQLTVLDAQRIIDQQSLDHVQWSEPFEYIHLDPSDQEATDDRSPDMLCIGTKFDIHYCYDNDLGFRQLW
jgi:hypothetical protein